MKQKNTSVVLHKEQMGIALETLNDCQLGELMRSFFVWVYNGTEIETQDGMVKYAFLSLKNQAKIDLAKYDEIREKRSQAGKSKKTNDNKSEQIVTKLTNADFVEQIATNETINNNNNTNTNTNTNSNSNKKDHYREHDESCRTQGDGFENVSLTDKVPTARGKEKSCSKKERDLEHRREDFYNDISELVGEYGQHTCRDFYDYWGEETQNGKKMRWELERTWNLGLRLKKWKANEQKFEGVKGTTAYRTYSYNEALKAFGNLHNERLCWVVAVGEKNGGRIARVDDCKKNGVEIIKEIG